MKGDQGFYLSTLDKLSFN